MQQVLMHDRPPHATQSGRASRSWPWALGGLCVLAFALRLGLALALPSIERPDELFQNIEPAWRMFSGHGVVTWEWRAGIRSPMFPGLLAGLMGAAAFFGAGVAGTLAMIWAAMSALSTGVVAAAFMAGRRHAGLAGGLACGGLCAVWPDLVYFGAKPLAEVQGANFLAIASLMLLAGGGARWGFGRVSGAVLLAVGVLLGLAFCLRYQLAPAILLVGAWAAWPARGRRLAVLVAGGCGPLLAMGLVDWAYWGAPFHSVLANFAINGLEHASVGYGIKPLPWYGLELAFRWGAAVVPVAIAAWAGLEAAPLLGWIILLVVGSHSLVGHKEISFVQAAMAPTLVLAGLGTCRWRRSWLRSLRRSWMGPVATWGVLAFWAATALATGCDAGFLPLWTSDHAALRAMAAARHDPDLCGLGVRWPVRWYWTGSDALLGRAVPIYAFGSAAGTRRVAPAISTAIGGPNVADGLPGFSVTRCWPDRNGQYVCLARAAHKICVDDPGFDLNAVPTLGWPDTQMGADRR